MQEVQVCQELNGKSSSKKQELYSKYENFTNSDVLDLLTPEWLEFIKDFKKKEFVDDN